MSFVGRVLVGLQRAGINAGQTLLIHILLGTSPAPFSLRGRGCGSRSVFVATLCWQFCIERMFAEFGSNSFVSL